MKLAPVFFILLACTRLYSQMNISAGGHVSAILNRKAELNSKLNPYAGIGYDIDISNNHRVKFSSLLFYNQMGEKASDETTKAMLRMDYINLVGGIKIIKNLKGINQWLIIGPSISYLFNFTVTYESKSTEQKPLIIKLDPTHPSTIQWNPGIYFELGSFISRADRLGFSLYWQLMMGDVIKNKNYYGYNAAEGRDLNFGFGLKAHYRI